MNTYYSELGRLLEERTPIRREGYYVLYENGRVGYALSAPAGAEIIDADRFVDALVGGCKEVIRQFADGPDNKEVYVFTLYADDQNSVYVYMNTLERFERTLKGYPEKQEPGEIAALKYSQGDFDFQFWQEHMGGHGRIVEAFEDLARMVWDLDGEESDEDEEAEPVVAFEAGIVKSGYHLLTIKAVRRLIEEQAFEPLHRTENFIAFASTGDDYTDYGVAMRRTIDPALFEEIFPDINDKDRAFREEMDRNRELSVSDYLDYWSDTVQGNHRVGSPFTYVKSEFAVFLQLEHFGNALAQECIARLEKQMDLELLTREDYDNILYYVEALHFAGELTGEQKEACLNIADRLDELTDDLQDTVRELANLSQS